MVGLYRFIGKATPRRDAVEIVTGGTRYLNDMKFLICSTERWFEVPTVMR
jgi:hypothetical protein